MAKIPSGRSAPSGISRLFRSPIAAAAKGAKLLAGSAALLLICCPLALAQLNALPNIDFKLGDDVATVKSVLKTDIEPEYMIPRAEIRTGMPPSLTDTTMIHLRTRGIWAFFDKDGHVKTIRVDAPFRGDILGLQIGDAVDQMLAKLGQPIRKIPSPPDETRYSYAVDDTAYAIFDTSDAKIDFILITK